MTHAFGMMSYPLPDDHWLYAERQYEDGADEPNELGKPILTHALRDAVVSAVRYAIRGATNCGKELDFDPDALVQNAVYALCGPYTTNDTSQKHVDETAIQRHEPVATVEPMQITIKDFVAVVEGKEDWVGKPVYWAQWPSKEQL